MENPLIGALDEVADLVGGANNPPENPPVAHRTSGTGYCDRNWVEVTVTNGRVSDCRIRVEALGLEPEEVAERVTAATNMALAEHDAALVNSLQEQQNTDLADLSKRLERISREAERGMDQYLDGLQSLLTDARKEIRG